MRDQDTNTVHLAHALKRYPVVLDQMGTALRSVGVKVKPIFSTGNIWTRDYMPLQVNDYFVKFAYKGYGPDAYEKYPQLKVPDSCWDEIGDVRTSDIILDGGNVVRYDDKILMTEIVYKHNPGWGQHRLRDQLSGLLQADIIFLPPEPGDDLGHTDGLCRWIDSGTVFLNDYRSMRDPKYRDYLRFVKDIFKLEGIETIPFPYAYDRCPEMTEEDFRKQFPDADDYNPGWGYFINYLQVKGAILYPTFGIEDDEMVEACLWDAVPDVKLFPIDCSQLSLEGGLCNCTTMNYVR